MAKKTYVGIVLDASGSMGHCMTETITGYNEQIQQIREDAEKGGETSISLWTFNANVYEQFVDKSPKDVNELGDGDYKPGGATALYDAVGQAINTLRAETNFEDEDNSYLLLIMSDGMENASHEWNTKILSSTLKTLQDNGRWTITYMGSNQDLTKVAQQLNLNKGNVINYTGTTDGTERAMRRNKIALSDYFSAREQNVASVKCLYNTDNTIADTDTQLNKKSVIDAKDST